MKFGTRVIVQRGSATFMGGWRFVPGKLVGAKGCQVLVKLDYYDSPYDTDYCKEHGIWFGKSVVTLEKGDFEC
jgi:hypothetical protein